MDNRIRSGGPGKRSAKTKALPSLRRKASVAAFGKRSVEKYMYSFRVLTKAADRTLFWRKHCFTTLDRILKTPGDVESLMSQVVNCFMGMTVGSKLVGSGKEVLNCIW